MTASTFAWAVLGAAWAWSLYRWWTVTAPTSETGSEVDDAPSLPSSASDRVAGDRDSQPRRRPVEDTRAAVDAPRPGHPTH